MNQRDPLVSTPPEVATPTEAPLPESGSFALPLSQSVTKDSGSVSPNDWARFNGLNKPTRNWITEQDVVTQSGKTNFAPQSEKDSIYEGIWYVRGYDSDNKFTLINISNPEKKITISNTTIDNELELGNLQILFTGTTLEEARYLLTQDSTIHQKYTNPTPKKSISDIVFTRELSHDVISRFLNHPLVQHKLGRNYINAQQRVAFGARFKSSDGPLVGLAELTIPSSRQLDQEKYIELKRFGSHPHHPPNIGSWLVSRALQWATLEGYEACNSYVGVNNNDGTLYKALNFSIEYENKKADGKGWSTANNRSERENWDDYSRTRVNKTLNRPVKGIHRRLLKTTEENQSTNAALSDFTDTNKELPIANVEHVSNKSLASKDDDIWHVRRDGNIDTMVDIIKELGTQETKEIAKSNIDHVFAATTREGISSVLALKTSPSDEHTKRAEITAYATIRERAMKNTPAVLISRARKWAGLQGYREISATPKKDTAFHNGLTQTGFRKSNQDTSIESEPQSPTPIKR